MKNDIDDCIKKLQFFFKKAYIYKRDELIVEPKHNIYFRIDNIQTEFEFRCKVVSWLSRPAHKGVSEWWQARIRNSMNGFLGTDFDVEQLSKIYTYVGSGSNPEMLKKFVESGYDLEEFEGRTV